ncbi:MAG: SIS domain-containing protein [Chloroflexi bacterium]|jgi:glucose/mannose-6-phosphate isomerase|nr:SIS domain-containing protein [Chloroflexota bacterium]
MNLDDSKVFSMLDPQNMIAEIDRLPAQLLDAWSLGQSLPLPNWQGIRHVLVAGMGSSALAADLLAAYVAPVSPVPVVVQRDYDLPAWAQGHETLVVALSHSGESEETLSVFERALAQDCRVIVISTGGALVEKAQQADVTAWRYAYEGQPRLAIGYAFGLLLGLVQHLGLVPASEAHLRDAVEAMRVQQTELGSTVPLMQNPAKRLAGQCVGRWVIVISAGILAPVARRWKEQINKSAKTWAQFEALPAANHTTLAGVMHPEGALAHTMVLFLRARSMHPRNQKRVDVTKEYFMLEGLGTDFVNAQGDNPLAEMWTMLQFGEYVAYYLAMAYQADPAPIMPIEGMKAYLRAA